MAPAARGPPTDRQIDRGATPRRPAEGAGNRVKSNEERPQAKPKPAARPAQTVERVTRAFSGSRRGAKKEKGAPAFRDTGGVQTPELPANRSGRGKVALAFSRKAAVRFSYSSPAEGGNEQETCALYGLSTNRR